MISVAKNKLLDDKYSGFEKDCIYIVYEGKDSEFTQFRPIFYSRNSTLILSLNIILPIIFYPLLQSFSLPKAIKTVCFTFPNSFQSQPNDEASLIFSDPPPEYPFSAGKIVIIIYEDLSWMGFMFQHLRVITGANANSRKLLCILLYFPALYLYLRVWL